MCGLMDWVSTFNSVLETAIDLILSVYSCIYSFIFGLVKKESFAFRF